MPGDASFSSSEARFRSRGTVTFLWGVGGVLLLLLQAQLRLGEVAWEALSSGTMTRTQLWIGGAWVLLNGYAEGYRGFQKRFVPRVLSRAHHLAENPGTYPSGLAPVFAMAYVCASRKAKISSWGVTIAVLLAILLVRQVPQPWRGIIDAGVVVGLTWGSAGLLWGVIQRLNGKAPKADPEMPAPAPLAESESEREAA